MTVYTDIDQNRGAEIARWAVCFAAVAIAHGLGAYVLFNNSFEDSEFGIEIPVVTIDLSESFVMQPAPPQEVAPGPMEEQESEKTPPKEEEIKPPEPEAEVALPKPEPPKPEPPAEEKQATAPPQAKPPPQAVARWESLLIAHIEHFKRYPAEARTRGEQGIARVTFTIDHEGHVIRSRIAQSSGSAALDRETLAMLVRAQPMPRPPDRISDGDLTFTVPVRFNIR